MHACFYLIIFFILYLIFFLDPELFTQLNNKPKSKAKSIRLNKKI